MNDHGDHGVEPDHTYAADHEANAPDDGDDPGEGEDGYDPHYLGGARKAKKKRGFSGCLAVIVALAVVVGGAYFAGSKGFHYLKDHLSHSADYDGPGHGKVIFQVKQGDSTTAIGQQPQGRRRGGLGRGVRLGRERRQGDPGRLLPAQEGDERGKGPTRS